MRVESWTTGSGCRTVAAGCWSGGDVVDRVGEVQNGDLQGDVEGTKSISVKLSIAEEDLEGGILAGPDVGGVHIWYVELALDHTAIHLASNLCHYPLCWSECSISVVSAHCPEKELPIVRPVLSTDEKHGGALQRIRSESHCDVPHGVSPELDGQVNAGGRHCGAGPHRRKQTARVSGRVAAKWCLQAQFSESTSTPSDVHLCIIGK